MLVVVLHTAAIYVFLIVTLSFLGQRQVSQLGIMELVVIMVLGSAVETPMVAADTSLLAGIVAASTLLLCNRLFSILVDRWDWLERVVVGRPIPLVYRGKLLRQGLNEAGLTEADVSEGIRERGYENIAEIKLAVLEIDGTISAVPSDGGNK